jgi:hypothetical protein
MTYPEYNLLEGQVSHQSPLHDNHVLYINFTLIMTYPKCNEYHSHTSFQPPLHENHVNLFYPNHDLPQIQWEWWSHEFPASIAWLSCTFTLPQSWLTPNTMRMMVTWVSSLLCMTVRQPCTFILPITTRISVTCLQKKWSLIKTNTIFLVKLYTKLG